MLFATSEANKDFYRILRLQYLVVPQLCLRNHVAFNIENVDIVSLWGPCDIEFHCRHTCLSSIAISERERENVGV